MAAGMKSWRPLVFLAFLVFISLSGQFEVREDEWEELRPDIAALHRLRGLPQQMFHERIRDSSNQRDSSVHRARTQRSSSRMDIENPMTLWDDLQECDDFTACVLQMEQDFESFLGAVDDQKTQDWLLRASEISHSYNQKLLVMTDTEKSTEDRVQEEYSMDPHYSLIVSKECLENVSCVPEADGYTVVKIFGSFSEDGNAVSGLSGSTLAELMLKPSLEAAPVFSLAGNSTTNFQHGFIRVFMVHGIKAVLETNQENHQMYQIMNEPGSVSGYKIPQRRVDHTTQYDHQQILIMEKDPVVIKAAAYLYEKHRTVSSVYVLDEHQKPKLIYGPSVPLSEESRLVVVGHGTRDSSGEARLAGLKVKEVNKIIEQTSRVSDKIKTISVVACEVGLDKGFIETMLKGLYEDANIRTELHIRDSVVQVKHTGEKITQEISPEGLKWRHNDESKKVVGNLDGNGNVIIRNEPGSKGEAVFTNERNLLMGNNHRKRPHASDRDSRNRPNDRDHFSNPPPRKRARQNDQTQPLIHQKPGKRFLVYRKEWPTKPKSFIDQNIMDRYGRDACHELEALSWGLFHNDLPIPDKVDINNLKRIEEHFVIGKHDSKDKNKIKWITDEEGLRDVLADCYEIKSGKDVRDIIRHYAVSGEDKPTYLMVKDWIYVVDPQTLYVYPVGKKLNPERNEKTYDIKSCIVEQEGKERYKHMRENIIEQNNKYKSREDYVRHVEDIFHGRPSRKLESFKQLSTEAWSTTYFTASVICESVRNFRTFPEVLMALDMFTNGDNNIREKAIDFFFENHPMARGDSWVDPSRRGFSGTATAEGSSKLENWNPLTKMELRRHLSEVIDREVTLYKAWIEMNGKNPSQIFSIAENYKIIEKDSAENGINVDKYNTFKEHKRELPLSGELGGHYDGHTTPQDLQSAVELENSFKLELYYSRVRSLFHKEVSSEMKARFGENLDGLRLQEGSARIEDGHFTCQLVPEGADVEPVEFRIKLSSESQQYNEKLLENIDTAVHELERHGSTGSHEVNKHVEHAGTAVGALGLMLGMKGAVRAFEEGDIKDGVVGSLQTAHGVTAMTTSVIAKKALTSETRIAKAVATVIKNPVMKRSLAVIPIVGIGFGVYNFIEDIRRRDTLGYIDAAIDGAMVVLDVVEMFVPELAPFIAPINLALSVVRMVIDDVYMSIQNELSSLPKDAGVLEKLLAVLRGFGKGIKHFAIQVASLFYDWHYDEIEEGHRLVAQISDHHKYYQIREQGGSKAIDFSHGDSSWNGGGIHFCLADKGPSELCMDYFVSSDESMTKKCWEIDTHGSKDIILGLGESHQLEYKTLQNKVLMFIPAGSVTVVSGYKAMSESRYGIYKGNGDSNRFLAVQESEDKHVMAVMLGYFYTLYGEPGDDVFILGPQKSYVEGAGGKDTYIIPKNGGKTIINNYDPYKALDSLHFNVDYSHISVSKSRDDIVFMYEGTHSVTVIRWFSGELYRHMVLMSGDGVLFEVSSTVVSSVRLVARGINKVFQKRGETVDASQPLLRTVSNIFGSQFDDVLIGNGEKNVIDGGGGRDHLIGGEEEDIYMVKDRQHSSVRIENHAADSKTDLAIIEANLHTLKVRVVSDDVVLQDGKHLHVTLARWFRSAADRHLLVVTKDFVTFSISDNKADCLQRDPFTRCIKSRSINYSSAQSAQVVDLQMDEALNSVTEVRGSKFDDTIRGNKEHNVIVPESGNDFLQGRGGEDWYIITPGEGVKTINNYSPDQVMDTLFLKEQYKNIICTCEGQSVIILVHGRKAVVLQKWFDSKSYQHLHIKTSDGVTAGLMANTSSCGQSLIFPLTVDYRNQKPEPLRSFSYQEKSGDAEYDFFLDDDVDCFSYRSSSSAKKTFCGFEGKTMLMMDTDTVREMYGSSGYDIMEGNKEENLLDPYTGGALMIGGEGKDMYIIKRGYGDSIEIDNFAQDQIVDTVLIDMDFLDGGQVSVDSFSQDLNVMITTKGEQIRFSLLDYDKGVQHQHVEFQSSDGVKFKAKSQTSTDDGPLYHIEAFKVTLMESEVDCRLDLDSRRNLSKVHTVQGCPSRSNDILGNDQDNALFGGSKDDALEGGEGDDTLIGGNGDDILIGDVGDDRLYGEDGNDTMMGNSGRDVFIPGPGADLVDGGPGRDTVLYRGDHDTGRGVYVNLLTGQGRYADAEGDVLMDVETVIGTIYSDILVSGYESSLLKGSDGDDILVSTGDDYLVGGDGHDVYLLAFHHGSVTIDNCAKDNATDVLYLSSQTLPEFDCQLLPGRALLTFFGLNRSTLEISVDGWTGDDNQCGHLMVVFKQMEVSVDDLLQESRLRQKRAERSLALSSVICIGLVVFHCAMIFHAYRNSDIRKRQQEGREQTETHDDEESVSMVAGAT